MRLFLATRLYPVQNLIEERARNNDTIVIWKNNKVMTVPAKNYVQK